MADLSKAVHYLTLPVAHSAGVSGWGYFHRMQKSMVYSISLSRQSLILTITEGFVQGPSAPDTTKFALSICAAPNRFSFAGKRIVDKTRGKV